MRRAKPGPARLAPVAGLIPQVARFLHRWPELLGRFGLHLIVRAAAAIRAPYLPRPRAWLLALAGLADLADALGIALWPGYRHNLAAYLVFGALFLRVRLLVRGLRR